MRELHPRSIDAQTAIREVRTVEGPALRRVVASVTALSETVGRLTREPALR